MVIRFFGILLGNTLNNWGLQIYINPFVTPSINYQDPRWMGAWWMTPSILGVLFIIPVILIALFPRHIRDPIPIRVDNGMPLMDKEEQPMEHVVEKPSLKDMRTSLLRLLKNKIVVYSILSYLGRRFGSIPYDIYMVKYMEQLYNVASADAK